MEVVKCRFSCRGANGADDVTLPVAKRGTPATRKAEVGLENAVVGLVVRSMLFGEREKQESRLHLCP
jgi:hypothetical protein